MIPRGRIRILVSLGALSFIGWMGWQRGRAVSVKVQKPQRTSIEQTVVASGRVLSPAKVNLGVLVQGIVGTVLADEGQHVRAGELLLTLQNDEYQALAKQAKGNLGLATARYQQLARVDAKLAKEQLSRAEKELQKAELDYGRTAHLASQGAVANSQLTDAEAALARAKEAKESAAIRVAATATTGSESQASLANITNAQGAVDFAATRVKYSQVIAPCDGVILTRSVEAGDVVSPGKTLLVLSRDGETRLLVQPDERALSVLSVGQLADASAEALPQQHFTAKLDWIAPVIDPSRGTVDVKLLVPMPPPYLKPEMTVQVTVHVARREIALVVPPELVFAVESNEPYVLRVQENRLARANVTLGLRSASAVEVTRGVGLDDWLVIPTNKTPKTGALVRPERQP